MSQCTSIKGRFCCLFYCYPQLFQTESAVGDSRGQHLLCWDIGCVLRTMQKKRPFAKDLIEGTLGAVLSRK